MPLGDWLAAYLEASTVDDELGVTDAELLVHLKRPRGAPTAERYDGEWQAFAMAPPKAAVEYVREVMSAGSITAAEVAEALAWRRANDPRYAVRA